MITHNRLLTFVAAAAILAGSAGAWAAGGRYGGEDVYGAGGRTGGAAGEDYGTGAGGRTGTMGETGAETGGQHPDAWLTTKVKSALLANQDTSGLDIQVQTRDNVVQLSGFVGSETEKRRAEEIARNIEGVKKVKNDIRVQAERR